MANDLEKKIIKQIEYYFGDVNYPRDKFLQGKIKEDDGWVPIEVLLTFKRLASLSEDAEVIAEAIKKSQDKIVVVSEDNKKVRRSPEFPPPEFNEDWKKQLMTRTAYAKGFPLDEGLDAIMTFLEPFGSIDCCTRRTYLDKVTKEHKFKGSCFIVFKEEDACKKFIEAETVTYNDKELIRKWQNDYLEEKRQEIEDRKKNKSEKKNAEIVKIEKKLDLPKGAVLHFTGIKEGETLTREDIKEKFADLEVDISFVHFCKGELEGHIRLTTENAAVEFHKTLTDDKLEIGDISLTFRVLSGDEEEEFLKKSVESLTQQRLKSKHASKNNRKRKGNFNYGGHKNKQSKS